MEVDMSSDFRWGGINGKGLCKAIAADLWMVFAVMVIAYLGLGIAGRMKYTPSYTSGSAIAVYPFNRMDTLDAAAGALETVGAVNEVFNSEMFRMGLRDRLEGADDFSLSSRQIDGTYILMLSASASSPDGAYRTLRAALDYYGEISSHLAGDSHLEILSAPDFPLSASNESSILRRRPLLTLFAGFAMGCFLVLMYAVRKTYKTAGAVRRCYKEVRFFRVAASASMWHGLKSKQKTGGLPNPEAVRKTALELLQVLRAKEGSSVFVTSAASGEGKTELTASLAGEMAKAGKSVLIVETEPENKEITERLGMSEMPTVYTLSELLQEGVGLGTAAADIPDQNIKVVFANKSEARDDFSDMAKDVETLLEQAEKIADVILIDGCLWSGSREERTWQAAADSSLAVCRQDKADFFAIDRMMTDLRENNPDYLGCILYGF